LEIFVKKAGFKSGMKIEGWMVVEVKMNISLMYAQSGE